MLLHLIDGTSDDVLGDYRTIEAELAAYGHGLADKPRIVALNKADALGPAADDLMQLLCEEGAPVDHVISGVTGAGVPEVLRALRAAILEARAQETNDSSEAVAWTP